MHIKFAHLTALAALAIPVLAAPLRPSTDLAQPGSQALPLALNKREPSGTSHKLPSPPSGSKPGTPFKAGHTPKKGHNPTNAERWSKPLPPPKAGSAPPPKKGSPSNAHPLPPPPKGKGGNHKRSTDEEELVKRMFKDKNKNKSKEPGYRLPYVKEDGSVVKPTEHPNPSSQNRPQHIHNPETLPPGHSRPVRIPPPPKRKGGNHKRLTDEAI